MTKDEKHEIINNYSKSILKHKTNIKSINGHKNDININNDNKSTDIEAIILDTRVIEKKKIKKDNDYDIQSHLNLVKIDIKEGDIHIIDTLFWDCTENNEYLTLLCSFKLLKDYIMDHHLSPTIDQINSMLLIIITTKRDKI